MKQQASKDEFGAFEKTTKGFGMKMLMKMGYKPGSGLGKDGSGIVEPIAVNARSGSRGLGFGDQDESPKRPRPESIVDDALASSPPRRAWKKKTDMGEGVIAAETRPPQSSKIIDFTGMMAKELGSLSELKSVTVRQETIRFPELRHNLALLIEMATKGLQENNMTKTLQEHLLARLDEQHDRLLSEIALIQSKMQNNLQIKSVLAQPSPAETFDQMAEWLQPLGKFVEQIDGEDHKVSLCSFIASTLTNFILRQNIDVLDEEFIGFCLRLKDMIDIEIGKYRSPYEQTVFRCILPKIKQKLDLLHIHDYESIHHASQLVRSWFGTLSPLMSIKLVQQTVLPTLNRLLAEWHPESPQKGGQSLHLWLLPWLEFLNPFFDIIVSNSGQTLKYQVDSFYESIRRKLSDWFRQHDDPLGDESLNIVTYWTPPVLPSREYDIFLVRAILPTMQRELEKMPLSLVDPDTAVMEKCLSWLMVIPASVMSHYMAKSLTDRFVHMIEQWMLQSDSNYPLVATWYEWWRDLLPDEIKNSQPILQCRYAMIQTMDRLSQ